MVENRGKVGIEGAVNVEGETSRLIERSEELRRKGVSGEEVIPYEEEGHVVPVARVIRHVGGTLRAFATSGIGGAIEGGG